MRIPKPRWAIAPGALALLLALLAVPPLSSAAVFTTLQSAATATGDGAPVTVNDKATVGVAVTGTFVGTVTWEGSTDANTTWSGVNCTDITTLAVGTETTTTGQFTCGTAGLTGFRARISFYTSGSITVTAFPTIVSNRGSGSGGLGAEVDTLQTVFARGKAITGANSEANCFRVGTADAYGCFFHDATLGWRFTTFPIGDQKLNIPANQNGGIWDEEGACWTEKLDPDGATPLAAWSYDCTTIRPVKSIWFGAGSLDGDGTQCPALATTVTINSGPKLPTFICTDNDGSTLYGSFKLVDNWNAGTLTAQHVYIQTAADTGVLNGDITFQCRGNGEVPSSTWGTEVALDDAAVVGSNANDFTTSAAATPAGTCAAGDMLYMRYQLDATGTTTAVATLHHLGFMVKYTETSRSH